MQQSWRSPGYHTQRNGNGADVGVVRGACAMERPKMPSGETLTVWILKAQSWRGEPYSSFCVLAAYCERLLGLRGLKTMNRILQKRMWLAGASLLAILLGSGDANAVVFGTPGGEEYVIPSTGYYDFR